MTLNHLSSLNGARIERELVPGPHAAGIATESRQARTSALHDHGRQRVTVAPMCARLGIRSPGGWTVGRKLKMSHQTVVDCLLRKGINGAWRSASSCER
jgi:hypothetical protein